MTKEQLLQLVRESDELHSEAEKLRSRAYAIECVATNLEAISVAVAKELGVDIYDIADF